MSRKTYMFEVVDATGQPFKRMSRRCNNLSAHDRAVRLVHKTPGAVAAFGYEVNGLSVHSAYRD